jgi:hypothetical protein
VYREWTAADGAKRSAHSIVGNVEFLAAPRSNGAASGDLAPVTDDQPEEDEIPFRSALRQRRGAALAAED